MLSRSDGPLFVYLDEDKEKDRQTYSLRFDKAEELNSGVLGINTRFLSKEFLTNNEEEQLDEVLRVAHDITGITFDPRVNTSYTDGIKA